MINQKRFYTRGPLRGIRISLLAKIPTLDRDWLISLDYGRGKLFELHRMEGGFKDIPCFTQNAVLFVDLLQNIF